MARKPRLFIQNVSQNLVIKGLNEQKVFLDSEDYLYALEVFANLLANNEIYIHSYVLLPTQINFYCTPLNEEALPKFMQTFGRMYVRYFNKKYKRTGTLWDGRYKSSLVEDILYTFDVMKYIETLPLKLNLTKDLSTYKYSSYHHNFLGKNDKIISEHILYKRLGENKDLRLKSYKSISLTNEEFLFVNESLNKQTITGSLGFCKNIEKQIGITILKKRGRPREENIIKRKNMYKKLVVLDKSEHKSLKVSPMQNLEFAKDLSFVPVVANEVALVGQTFPVVFTADENPSLVSIVSLGGSNLALTPDFKWITNYVPVNLRKYPFSIASVKEKPEQKIILIDEESSLVSKREGKTLFNKEGEQTELLQNAVKFLQDVDAKTIVTANIAKLIANSGILEDREITIGQGDEKKVFVKGFKVVSKEKLNALGDEVLADWVRKGIITFIDAHLKSLENIQTLFNLASKKQ